MSSALRVVLLASCIGACGGSAPELVRPVAPRAALREANLLVRPVPDGAALLGREVTASDDGSWRIAPELAPGCRVEVRRVSSDVRERHRVRVRSLAALDVDYLSLARLGVGASSIAEVELDVRQSQVLSASTSGPCGSRIISTVYVGVGSQSFFGHGEATAGGGAGVGPIRASTRGEAELQLGDSIAWGTPSAYAFEPRQLSGEAPIALRADLPSQLEDGELLEVRFDASRPAYLVVFSVDARGQRALLWPSNEEPSPLASPDAPAHLPSAAERARGFQYRLALPSGQVEPAHESLLVFAFTERGDYELVHPHTLGGGEDYGALLDARLAELPAARWSRYVFGYTLRPASTR